MVQGQAGVRGCLPAALHGSLRGTCSSKVTGRGLRGWHAPPLHRACRRPAVALLAVSWGTLRRSQAAQQPSQGRAQVLLTLGGYGTIAFIYNLEDELMPLYASAPLSAGGLSLATSQLAVPLILGGASVAVFALWGYPRRAPRHAAVRNSAVGTPRL